MQYCKSCNKFMSEDHFIRVVPEPGKEYAQAGDDVLNWCKNHARLHQVSFKEAIDLYRSEHSPGFPLSVSSAKDRIINSYREEAEKSKKLLAEWESWSEQMKERLQDAKEKIAEQAHEIEQLTVALEEARTADDSEDEIEKLSESLEQANKRIEALRDELLKNDGSKYEYYLQPNSRIGKRRK